MYCKCVVEGQKMGWDTAGEFASLAFSFARCRSGLRQMGGLSNEILAFQRQAEVVGERKMLIKFFVEATEEELAISIVNRGLYDAQKYVKEKEIKNILPYWKEKNMYIVELALEIYQGALHNFLQVFSDAWLELGYPVDELLASRNNKDCAYMKEGFVLINVFISA